MLEREEKQEGKPGILTACFSCHDTTPMRRSGINTYISVLLLVITAAAGMCHGQTMTDAGKDTVYFDELPAAKVYARVPKQKGKEWRRYYRLVHNFSKAYPYALVAKKIVMQADSTIESENMKWLKRGRYVDAVQAELFEAFEKPLRKMTISQGMLLMKLIDREVGKSSYTIIKEFKNGLTAGFWQGVAKLFGSDLKKPYDPEGEDANVEELVKIWEAGDFPAFYFSLFWKDPPEVVVPEKYR